MMGLYFIAVGIFIVYKLFTCGKEEEYYDWKD